MKALILASVMMANPTPSLQQSGVESGVYDTSSHVSETVAATIPLDNTGVQITIILGALLLGSGLAPRAYNEYIKRTPLEKRIGARVMRILGESKKS